MTSVEIALTFSLRNTHDFPRINNYGLTVNWQASIYFPLPHQSRALFASVRSFPKEQWYRAGVFFFLPSSSSVSFFRPHTYRKGYHFYSSQSSTVIKSKMAATAILWTRTRFCPPKIRLHCRLALATHHFLCQIRRQMSQTRQRGLPAWPPSSTICVDACGSVMHHAVTWSDAEWRDFSPSFMTWQITLRWGLASGIRSINDLLCSGP